MTVDMYTMRGVCGAAALLAATCLAQGWQVELHTHIDGSLSPLTLWRIAHSRGLQSRFPADVKKPEDLRKYISVSGGETLQQFLATFDFFLPFLKDSTAAVEELARAFTLQQAAAHVLYTEGRFAPQLLNGTNTSADDIVAAVLRGINTGVNQAGVQGMRVNVILCCMRGLPPSHCHDVVRMAVKFRNSNASRVVGIDMAEGGGPATAPFADWVPSFLSAHAQNVDATVHAGESCVAPESCPHNCETALQMKVTRVGHGYNCGEQAWEDLNRERIHLEGCPSSSVGTGAVKSWSNHPIKKYADRNYSFGISTDDGGVLETNETNEVAVAQTKIGLSSSQVTQAMRNAAKAAFLPANEVEQLLLRLDELA